MDQLYQRPGVLFRRCRQRIGILYLRNAVDVDLTPQQFTALHAINEFPWIEQTTLCNIIMLDRSTVATQLARLEDKGFVTRKSASDNPRKNLIKLTPAGRAMLARVTPILNRVEEQLLAPLTSGEQAMLVDLMSRVATAQNGDT